MRIIRISLIPFLIAALVLILIPCGTSPVRAANVQSIPVKALVLVDEEEMERGSHSNLFQVIKESLDVNKIPFNTVDISEIDKHSFLDDSSSLRYSVLIMLSPGWKLEPPNSELIIDAAEKGMGVISTIADSTNSELMPIFGIDKLGTRWLKSPSFQIVKDKFTFSYKDEIIEDNFGHLDHHLLPDAEVIAKFTDSNEPALWTYKYGAGKTVFHNHTISESIQYWGILLQSILYAMPLGVACPINAGAIEVDDCPRSFYSAKELQDWHYTFYRNFKEWLQTYNFTASFFIAFSYSGDISDFWVYPESLDCANDIIESGYEFGLHCGNEHTSLKVAYWDSKAAIDAEVDEMTQAWELLGDKLYDKYGTQLGEMVSYIAPNLEIGDYGYEALDTRTPIKYVGTYYFPADKVTDRDFGWERNLDIYNLPRIKGGFYEFNRPQSKEYAMSWHILRSTIESGDSYLIFTHPDELELLNKEKYPDATMTKVFEGFNAWGDYVSRHYPFYRWWTSAELGQYLENREGVLDAEWFPEDNVLKLKLSQPDDAIHLKTQEYLKSISQAGETITLTFSSSPYDFVSDKYDVVNIGQDYFIYPEGSKSSMPVVPKTPFEFRPAPDPTPAPTPITEPPNAQSELPLPTLLGVIVASIILVIGILLMWRGSKNHTDTNEGN